MNEQSFTFPLLHNAIGIMTPFLLAATGGLFTELAGMLNIALEGLMLIGAFFSVVFAGLTGSLILGILLGVASAVASAALFGTISLLNCDGSSLTGYRRHIGRLAGLGVEALLPGHGGFCLGGGQGHIDVAIEAFKSIWPPPNYR